MLTFPSGGGANAILAPYAGTLGRKGSPTSRQPVLIRPADGRSATRKVLGGAMPSSVADREPLLHPPGIALPHERQPQRWAQPDPGRVAVARHAHLQPPLRHVEAERAV